MSFPILHRLARHLAWAFGIGCVLLSVCYLFRAPLLAGLAEAWVINDPAAKADAIVIPGGAVENRPFAAAKLYHDGVAPMILYMNVKLNPAEELGIYPPEAEQTRRVLMSNNVPATAMTLIGTDVASTYDEACAVRAWAEKSGAKAILVPTSPFHTRRVRWIYSKELRSTGTEIHVIPVKPVRYRVKEWWQHEEGVLAFQNEVVKYLYYRWEY